MSHNIHNPGVGDQTPALMVDSTSQQTQDVVATTSPDGTDQVDCQHSEVINLNEPEIGLGETIACSPTQSQHNSTTSAEHQTPPLTLSAQETKTPGSSDFKASSTCNPSMPPGKPDLAPTKDPIQRPPPLPLSESLGFEGIIGIVGGCLGILGIFGFLIFLWFGCKLYRFLVQHVDASRKANALIINKMVLVLRHPKPRGSGGTWLFTIGCPEP